MGDAVTDAPAFSADDLRARLSTRVIGRDLRVCQEIDSTSSEARRIVGRGESAHGLCIVAHRQTVGRGTGGKVWESSTPVGLWSTTILEGGAPSPVSLLIGCAVADAIRDVSGGAADPHLKWPNDVLIDTPSGARKVSGILVETAFAPGSREPAYLVGIGINVAQESFEGELRDRAASLRMAGVETDVPRVFGALMGAIERHLESDEPVARRWVARTRMIDTEAAVVRGGDRREVTVRGITADGRLVTESGDGRRETISAASDMDLVWPMSGDGTRP